MAQTTHRPSLSDLSLSSAADQNRVLGITSKTSATNEAIEQKPPELPVSEQRTRKSSLWALAYECFQRDDPKLARGFGDCLGIDPLDITAGLDQVTHKALETIREAQDAKDSLHKTPLGRYLIKSVEVIIASKDFIGAAVSAEPHAALAWCGVSLLLPVSLPDNRSSWTYHA